MNIIFVCTGNTCRSPMAEALFKSIAEAEGLDVSVRSAGVFASPNGKASPHAIEALFEKRIALNHVSSPLTEEHMESADLVLAMTHQHKQVIVNQFERYRDKVFTLKEYVTGSRGDIIDPFGGSIEIYKKTRDELEELLRQLAERLKNDGK
ncbi:low molecular weight protein arginine phosphatase [Bacillus halotolerans]|uniref:low molecular weight protein arginine phosphatase n=1 Tax=Bacillus halotolerans TaxID=260554 RepID=UPI0007515639|nr:low molecular weight protein arginine phosphatase [Bacillus halotolerans]QQF63691.1 low molecular weight protein arginine phosphatase [Bacillus mojavensis]KUP36352.1 protein tyrosine phosphatase [Bacillus halotolerans]MBT9248602.1 low molecular weight protein arginine phosphatase [Bacillus halotolerans]MBV5121855.1 low molecular weight protein arginine phosphatase [Bacillus halotolerans]MEC1405520.1 low molecular weight protein arginine phosphatase [Bacillus halotolerans]